MLISSIKSYAASSEFTYELDANNYASITSYKGTSGNVTIPSIIDGYEVKSIANHAFNNSRNNTTNGKALTNVIISEGITTIGDYSFVGCTNLESVKVPETVTSMGFQTFVGCSKLTKINIPSKVKTLSSCIFQETGFTEFEVPENIEEMNNSFRLCSNLKKVVIYNKNLKYHDTLSSRQVIDTEPFERCSSDLVLYGYKGSTTEGYAKEKGFTFKDIESLSEDILVEEISLNIGETETITATVLPQNATDNKNVATVEEGKITAISEGTATITATSHDGSVKATCKVTVTKKAEKPVDNGNGQEDTTTVKTEIPKAGASTIIIALIILTVSIALIVRFDLKNYKDIK